MSKQMLTQRPPEMMEAALVDYQNQQLTTDEIAQKYGIGTATLTVWAKNRHLTLRKRGRRAQKEPTIKQREIIRLSKSYTLEQVGARFGMHKQAIHRIVHRWQKWTAPNELPFIPGDVLLWRAKKYTVVDSNAQTGTLIDESGKRYKNFEWATGHFPKKIGFNPAYATPKAA